MLTPEIAVAAEKILTCAPLDCRHEGACFELARYVKAAQKRYGVIQLPPPADCPPLSITPATPHWEYGCLPEEMIGE